MCNLCWTLSSNLSFHAKRNLLKGFHLHKFTCMCFEFAYVKLLRSLSLLLWVVETRKQVKEATERLGGQYSTHLHARCTHLVVQISFILWRFYWLAHCLVSLRMDARKCIFFRVLLLASDRLISKLTLVALPLNDLYSFCGHKFEHALKHGPANGLFLVSISWFVDSVKRNGNSYGVFSVFFLQSIEFYVFLDLILLFPNDFKLWIDLCHLYGVKSGLMKAWQTYYIS